LSCAKFASVATSNPAQTNAKSAKHARMVESSE
jgi:hypothetical protein